MVADKVELFTKSNDSDGVYRSSTGDADYEIEENDKSDRGTRIVLHLNDESTEYSKIIVSDLWFANMLTIYL